MSTTFQSTGEDGGTSNQRIVNIELMTAQRRISTFVHGVDID